MKDLIALDPTHGSKWVEINLRDYSSIGRFDHLFLIILSL